MKTFSTAEMLSMRPLSAEAEARVADMSATMLAEVRAHRLAEIRKAHQLTQEELAKTLKVSQHRVSQIERGGTVTAQVDTLRRYVEALGGRLAVRAEFGDNSFVIA